MIDREFDAHAKEAALRAESESWNTTVTVAAEPGDIPIIDVSTWFEHGDVEARDAVASELRSALETVGFFQLVGHGISTEEIDTMFDAARRFHALPVEVKSQIRMDRDDWPLGGVGYLPVGERKLPRRQHGNLNEAFIVKSDAGISSDDNQWLPDDQAPGFRQHVEQFGKRLEELACRLLPAYATALGVASDFFDEGFADPFWRLRMTHYPPQETSASSADDDGASGAFGIAPHVDTTFLTLLLQDSPGLTIYHTLKDQWVDVPLVDGAFVVNSGELLRQWTNDRYLSVRHFANVDGSQSRYSIPFFFNAARDYRMECIPTCCSADNPARYPPLSYNEGQGVVQGE